jgi:hypothetical protein
MILHKFTKYLLTNLSVIIILFAGLLNVAIAEPLAKSAAAMSDRLVWTEKKGQLKLTVEQMSLPSVLKQIAKKKQFPLHLDGLPEKLISMTCTGTELRQIMECLLDNKADLIVRYQQANLKNNSKPGIAEAWIIPSNSDHVGIDTNKPSLPVNADEVGTQANINTDGNKIAKIDNLLDKAQSSDKRQKAAALGALLAAGRKGDSSVRNVLEQALADDDPEVRAQALSSLVHREGNDAMFAVQQGLHDESEDVRLIAVEGIKDDIALLQQAINDSDEVVRSLAEIKLQLLMQKDFAGQSNN